MDGKISFLFNLKKLSSFSVACFLSISLLFSQYLGLSHGIYHFVSISQTNSDNAQNSHNERTAIQNLLDSHFEASDGNPEQDETPLIKFKSKSCTLFDLLMLLSSVCSLSFFLHLIKSRFHFLIDTFAHLIFGASFKNYLSRAPPLNNL